MYNIPLKKKTKQNFYFYDFYIYTHEKINNDNVKQ